MSKYEFYVNNRNLNYNEKKQEEAGKWMNEWMNEKNYIARLKACKCMLNLPRLAEN